LIPSRTACTLTRSICLIQYSTPGSDFLVDLSVPDLSPLDRSFQPGIEKVFHAATALCRKRDGFEFANLFDTMVAARILGREALGLGALLEAEFGLQVDKRYQRADWGQRPLPAYLLAYAQVDTHYLIPLRDRLRQALVELGLWPLAVEDFNRVSHVNGRLMEERVDNCWRVSGSYDLTPRKAAVLMELCRYRDRVARSANRPLFKVLNDSTLLAIANELPADVDALRMIPGMTPGQIKRHGKWLLAAVNGV
jgi:ribonuclease D